MGNIITAYACLCGRNKRCIYQEESGHTCNPGTQEAGGGASQTPDQLEFHNEIPSNNRVRGLLERIQVRFKFVFQASLSLYSHSDLFKISP